MIERRPYPIRGVGRPKKGAVPATLERTALCTRCGVFDEKARLVIETERDADGRWIATRVVHADDPCPESVAWKQNPWGNGRVIGEARGWRGERREAIRLA